MKKRFRSTLFLLATGSLTLSFLSSCSSNCYKTRSGMVLCEETENKATSTKKVKKKSKKKKKRKKRK